MPTEEHQPDLTGAIQAVLDALQRQARNDHELRRHLRVIGAALLSIAGDHNDAFVKLPSEGESSGSSALQAADVADGRAYATVDASVLAQPLATDDDIKRLAAHFAGELDAADQPVSPLPSTPSDQDEAIQLAELSDCFQAKAAYIRQALSSSGKNSLEPSPCTQWIGAKLKQSAQSQRSDWEVFAGSCEVVALIADALSEIVNNAVLKEYLPEGLLLAAEAQSAVAAAVRRLYKKPDPAQERFFRWLRQRTDVDRVYLPRYMWRDDTADPDQWQERLARVQAWRETLDKEIYRRRHERKLFGKLRYQLSQVVAGAADQWPRALQTINALIDLGVPPSHRMLRQLLWPFRDQLNAASAESRQLGWVAREVARAATSPSDTEPLSPADRDEKLVEQVADLLRNTSVVLIGGDERPLVRQTIEEAFGLRELIWCDTRPHQSHLAIEPFIARPEVSVVLLAIRWASHRLGAVREFCERYNKPFVRLPAGYSINQIAYQIWEQASERLRA
ncbi:hypothetical protein [Chloroflexus sp.]|uniref:hypothetical protein n=1 Tax=Chloroflexus sp. TaxID=1904827 RepID=UPI002ACD20F1|nr:hypothetical protein [Chloroflexus sp.]